MSAALPLLLAAIGAEDRFDCRSGCASRLAQRFGDACSLNQPRSTRKKLLVQPSSLSNLLNGGIEPGAIPPMSEWWPRDASQNTVVQKLIILDICLTVTNRVCG